MDLNKYDRKSDPADGKSGSRHLTEEDSGSEPEKAVAVFTFVIQ